MTSNEAAAVIRAMSRSLTNNPAQFNIQVNVTGQQVTSHGGTGLQITATGGGPGSTTIGQAVSASAGNVQIDHGRQAFRAELDGLIKTLNQIAAELETPSPEPGRLKQLCNAIGAWVPGVITSVVGNVISAALGSVLT